MKIFYSIIYGLILFLLLSTTGAKAADGAGQITSAGSLLIVSQAGHDTNDDLDDEAWEEENWEDEWGASEVVADPLEPLNRFFFLFNDKLYYWVLKPVAKVYAAVTPDELHIAFRNFFDNLETPARAVNSLLQGKPRDSLTEVARFTLNSTVGIAGLADFAKDVLKLRSSEEDLGQTFAHYGAGAGFYIVWPFLGPSNLRDSVGMVGDSFLDPLVLLDAEDEVIIGARILKTINYTALTMGDYELFTETALDPYTAVKDAYQQYRKGLIENK